MFETEVLAEGGVDDFDSHCHESPALFTDICLRATRTDVIVIGQINIEH
jgi:hypothetical protein